MRLVRKSLAGRYALIPLILLSAASLPLRAATFTVNSILDAADANPGDGICESAPGGPCTLRAAVEEANADLVRDRPRQTLEIELTQCVVHDAAHLDAGRLAVPDPDDPVVP